MKEASKRKRIWGRIEDKENKNKNRGITEENANREIIKEEMGRDKEREKENAIEGGRIYEERVRHCRKEERWEGTELRRETSEMEEEK